MSVGGWRLLHRRGLIGLVGFPLLVVVVLTILGDAAAAQAGPLTEAAAAAAAAVVIAVTGGRRPDSRTRQTWLLVAVGLAIWAIGRLLAVLMGQVEASSNDVPSLGLANAGYLIMTPFLIAGILQSLPSRQESAPRSKVALDVLIGFASLVTISWFFILGPLWSERGLGVSAFGKVAALVHVVGNVGVLMSILLVGLRLGNRPISPSLGALAGGVIAFTVADTLALKQWLHLSAANGALSGVSVLTVAALLAIGLAGSLERRGAREQAASADANDGEPLWRVILPYALALMLVALIAAQELANLLAGSEGTGPSRGSGAWILIAALTVVSVIIVRQGLTMRDARMLTKHLSQQVDRDPLTGLFNHRKAQERIVRELGHGRDWGHPLAVALIDVDDFKNVNDVYGHLAGDEVLRTLAATLAAACRGTDVAARYAGDEFILVLPGADVSAARVVGERILRQVQSVFDDASSRLPPVSVSLGFAVTSRYVRTAEQLVAIADAAMYDAKESGKNRAVIVDADSLVAEPSLQAPPTIRATGSVSSREAALRALVP